MTEAISQLDSDLIGVAEYEPSEPAELYDLVADRYPYHVFYRGDTDVGLLSRYPILSQQLIAPADMRSAFIRAQVTVQGTPVVVYVVHLTSPHIALPFTYDDSARDREVAFVLERLREETGPVLLLGDFNLSDQSDAYRSFDRLLADAFRERGRGFGFTFPSQRRVVPPLIRIDYVWHSDHFVTRDAWLEQDSGTSDHRPVMAVVALKQQA